VASFQPFRIVSISSDDLSRLTDVLAQYPHLFSEGRVACHIAPQIRAKFPDKTRHAQEDLLAFTRQAVTQTAFRATKGWHLLAGTLLNLPRIFRSPTIACLEGINAGRPAVIVGAGPALDHDALLLAAHRDKALVIACDAAWNTLMDHGIKPDLVISTDSRDCTWQHLERGASEQPDVPVITTLSGSWSVVRYYPGPLLFARQDWPLDRIIQQAVGHPIPQIDPGKCVGNAAFELAVYLQSERIIMIGFNLGYEGDRYHPAQRAVSEFHDNPHAESNLLQVPGNEEEKIRTDYSMYYYLQYFEQQISHSNTTVYNATTGGALIHGTRRMSLTDAIPTDAAPLPDLAAHCNRSASSHRSPDQFLAQLRQQCIAYLQEIESILKHPESHTARSGSDPLPSLNRHREMQALLLSADNPALSAALQLDWENLLQRNCNTLVQQSFIQSMQRCLQHRSTVIQLLLALLGLSPNEKKQPGHWFSISSSGTDHDPFWQKQLRTIESNRGIRITPCREDPDNISALWQKFNTAEGVIMHNSCLMPFVWAFPGIKCLDVISTPPGEQTLIEQWLPGYEIITSSELEQRWRARVPASIPVQSTV
jgi:hypothetical protein